MSSRTSIAGLRNSDPLTLSILLQDVLRKPLVQVEPACLCDLLALAEAEELPPPMKRDLSAWTPQMLREFRDLPDLTGLADFVRDLLAMDPAHIPTTMRNALAERQVSPAAVATAKAIAALQEKLAATPPKPVVVKVSAPTKKIQQAPPPPPPPGRFAAVNHPRGMTGGAEEGEPRAPRAPRTPAAPKIPVAQVDPRREEWIREVVLERLGERPDVKQSVLVAGLKHRSPWKDMEDEELLKCMRKMEREGRLKQSGGRWSRLK